MFIYFQQLYYNQNVFSSLISPIKQQEKSVSPYAYDNPIKPVIPNKRKQLMCQKL